jgi:hypothetical protein
MIVHRKPVLRLHLILMTGLALAGMALLPASASAQMWSASGSDSDGQVMGSASFSLDGANNRILIMLTNTLDVNQFRSAGQALSDVVFTLSNSISTTSTSATTGGGAVTLHGDGSVSSASPNSSTWKLTGGGTTFTLDTTPGGAHFMIAPSPASSGTPYPDVNNGIKSHNPYFEGGTLLTISNVSGLTRDTKVTAVSLSFGTGPDVELAASLGTPGAVPAPPSIVIAMTGVGAVGFFGFALSSRRRKAAIIA